MSNEQDSRRSFRVSESVYLKYEKLTEDEFQEGIERRKLRLGGDDGAQAKLVDIEARLSEAMFLLNGEHSQMGRCITLMNDKLNVAIDQLPSLRESKASLARIPPQTCDVSADGLVFSSAEQMQIGDKLSLTFLLSSDNRFVETFGKVVRLADPPDASSPEFVYGIAVEFVNMPATQREILIQHMFSRESETLRMRRLEMDGT